MCARLLVLCFRLRYRDPPAAAQVSHDAGGAVIPAALEAAGVIFVAENGEVPGVRLRKQRLANQAAPANDLNSKGSG